MVLLVLVSCGSNFGCGRRCYSFYVLRFLRFLTFSVLFENFFSVYPVGLMRRHGLAPRFERLKLLVKTVGLLLQPFFLPVRDEVLVVVVSLDFYHLTRLLLLLLLLLVSLQDVGDKERCGCGSGCRVAIGGGGGCCLRWRRGPGAAARRTYCCRGCCCRDDRCCSSGVRGGGGDGGGGRF